MKGITVEGTNYDFVRSDGTVVYGKKDSEGVITMQKSKTGKVFEIQMLMYKLQLSIAIVNIPNTHSGSVI